MSFLAKIIATFFGIGYLRPGPGTWGSFAALPLGGFILLQWGNLALFAATCIVFLIGIWASGRYAADIKSKDPSEVVIDEVAGQWMAMVCITPVFWQVLAAFVLFRLFDITKPWLIGRLERLPGGLGIMADDLLAGAVAGVLIFLIQFVPLWGL